MKRLKLAVLIFAALIVHIAVNRYVNVFNAVPDIFLALSLSYAVIETEIYYTAGMSVVCGLISSALSANGFYINMIVFVIGCAAVYEADKKIRTMPKWSKSALSSLIVSAVGGFAVYIVPNMDFSLDAFLSYLLPSVIFNTVYVMIIYPILKKVIRLDKIHSSLLIS
ncbi:MAG: rod shape-determining protein MreD [Firmicutes bacterium]|nr:rod shape-determining protein MreD [Bacillota bacterium]